jgi:Vacuolar protein 14 C-terminal Fig4p binding
MRVAREDGECPTTHDVSNNILLARYRLLESPIFVNLRLQLLDVESRYHAPLLKSIYGLLMCLPQGDAFRLLNDRLTTVCNLRDNLGIGPMQPASNETSQQSLPTLQLQKLLKRYDDVVLLHRIAKERSHKIAVHEEQSKHQPGSYSVQEAGAHGQRPASSIQVSSPASKHGAELR